MSSLNFNGNVNVGRDLNIKQNTIQKQVMDEVKKVAKNIEEEQMLISAINTLTATLQEALSNSTIVDESTSSPEEDTPSFKDNIINTFKKIGSVSTELLGTVITNVLTNLGSKYL